MKVGKILSELAVNKASGTAIIFNEKQFTYGNLNAIANSLANYLLDSGIKQRDNIAVIFPNCPEFAFVYFAVAKLGAIFNPIDIRLSEKEINSILHDAKAKVCFIFPGFPHKDKLIQSLSIIDIAGEEFRSLVNNPP